ncbi:OFA family MFS transporter [Herbivorax sp. ANBcel31]|uniref:L-lactate MFS transporter n=1 Tax=Herbivorax sp. ANBcel31 TaxID=3069754 RepID=UPI0027B8496C|nr:OFA family MFS transporter [Herbivorax sp. ANBcel31]MDQ2086583.1 OFA family MFS transporter [Herbivorax sp. ANBcel31]
MNKSKGWIVTSAATGINLILGLLYIWSIMGEALIDELDWNSTQAQLPYTISIVSFSLIMIFAGRIQDLKGPRLSSIFGGILLGGGLILSGFVTNPYLMTLTYGLMGGAGIGFCYAATTPPAVKWFPLEKKGFISGIVVSGVGFAGVYISPLTNMLIDNFGVSNSFIMLGFFALIILITLSQLLVNPSEAYIDKINNKSTKKKSMKSDFKQEFSWQEMLKTFDFYKLWIMYTFSASAGLMLIGHITRIASKQAGWEEGFYFVVLLAIFNTLGRIVGGLVCDKLGAIKTMLFVFSLQAINIFLFSQYTTPLLLALGVAVTGLGYGALFSIFPAVTAQNYGTKNLGTNYGFVFTSWGLAGVTGPLLAGKLFDLTDSYNYSYLVSGLFLVAACILTFSIKKSKDE